MWQSYMCTRAGNISFLSICSLHLNLGGFSVTRRRSVVCELEVRLWHYTLITEVRGGV